MPQRSHRILAALLYSLLVLLGGSCARRAPSLLAVSEVSPARIEARDVLSVAGEGFVAASNASLRFRGTTHQPGEPPRAVDYRVVGNAVDQETIELVVSEAMIQALSSGHDGSSSSHHATFRGEVEVAFSPRVSGAPPIVGRATNVVLDVFRNTPEAIDATTETNAAQWLGLEVRELGAGGLEVTSLTPELPAARSGILVGDVLRSWSSVRLHSASDVEPYPGQRSADVTLTRDGIAGPMHVLVEVNGYAPLGASGWSFGLVLLGLLAAAVALSRTQLSHWFVWLVLNAGIPPRDVRTSHRSLALWPFLIVSGLFLVLATRQRLVPLQLDLAWLALLASMAAGLFGTAGAFRAGRWSLRGLALAWWRQTPVHLVLWLAVVVLVLERGSASLWELAQPQSIHPRSLGAFTSPASYLATWSLLIVLLGVWLGRYPSQQTEVGPSARWMISLARGAGDLHSLLMAALVVSVFGGGWSVSLHSVGQLGLAEALSFQLRFTATYAGLVWLRRSVPAPPMDVVEAWTWRLACPLITLSLVLLPVWWAEVWPEWLRLGVQNLLLGITALVVFGVPITALLVRRREGVRRLKLGLNPWL